MKQLLLICAVVALLVGCGEAEQEAAPMAQAHAGDVLTYEDSEEAHAAAETKRQSEILEKAIRKAAKKPTGELTKAAYEKVWSMHFTSAGLTSVKGLEKLTNLERLGLYGNQLTDVMGLERLTKLKFLDLNNNKLTNVNGLEKLTQLTTLYLYGNQLTSVEGLENLTQLMLLALNDNPDLTKAQIAELQKALPKCKIEHNAK